MMSELIGMRNREGTSLREYAALTLAVAMLGGIPEVSRDVYHQMAELLDGVVVLPDWEKSEIKRGREIKRAIAIREEWRKHE